MNNQIQWDRDEVEQTRKLADAKAKALQATDELLMSLRQYYKVLEARQQLKMSLRRYYAVLVKNTEN